MTVCWHGRTCDRCRSRLRGSRPVAKLRQRRGPGGCGIRLHFTSASVTRQPWPTNIAPEAAARITTRLSYSHHDGVDKMCEYAHAALQLRQRLLIECRTGYSKHQGQHVLHGPVWMKTLTVGAEATASMQGSSLPWNVAVIIDSTGSMATADSNCGRRHLSFNAPSAACKACLRPPILPHGPLQLQRLQRQCRRSLFTFPNVLTSYNGTRSTR